MLISKKKKKKKERDPEMVTYGGKRDYLLSELMLGVTLPAFP